MPNQTKSQEYSIMPLSKFKSIYLMILANFYNNIPDKIFLKIELEELSQIINKLLCREYNNNKYNKDKI